MTPYLDLFTVLTKLLLHLHPEGKAIDCLVSQPQICSVSSHPEATDSIITAIGIIIAIISGISIHNSGWP